MKLENATILLDDGHAITQAMLEKYREESNGRKLMPEIIPSQYSDREIIDELLNYIPVVIVGGESSPAVLEASFARFPYSIDDQENFAEFALRLVPRDDGIVDHVKISGLVIIPSASPHQVVIDSSPVRLSIFYRPEEPNEPLGPPAGYQKKRFTSDYRREE